ncbi:MAG: DNA polymerase I [Lachnospiraceae bacterium]|nr:DNA polymerase I [Lachnospiraceae bacterium]
MSKKIVLIDGHSILNRAFFGIPDLTNAEGLHTNAVYGFLNILFRILEEEKPEYLTVAFDVHAPTFRHKMYEAYKGTRKPMAEELRQQVPVMKEVLKAMGVAIVEKEGYEADDILGTIAKRCEREGIEVSLVSGDRDLLQLASEHIRIRIPKTKRTGTEIEDYYAGDVKEKYQVTPEEFIDVKALMGDTADNIPGVPGIGEKTATNLIAAYGSIENAYEHIDEVKPPRAQNNLKEHFDMAKMSKVLATIELNVPLDYDVAQAELNNLFTPEAYVWMKKLEFKQMLNRFSVETPENPVEQYFQMISEKIQADEIFAEAQKAECVGFYLIADRNLNLEESDGQLTLEHVFGIDSGGGQDTEVSSGKKAQIFGLALAYGEQKIFFLKVNDSITGDYLTKETERMIRRDKQTVSFDMKSQLSYLTVSEKSRNYVDDALIQAYLLNPLKNDYAYDDVAKEHLDLLVPSQTDLLGKLSLAQAVKEKSTEVFQYGCWIAYTVFKAADILRKKLEEAGMWKLYREIEMPLTYTLYDMEQEGVLVNASQLRKYGENLSRKIAQLEQEIYQDAGETFNINSPKQLGVILFEKLKMPYGKKTKTGFSTAADVLEKLAGEYPLVSKILEYRQLAKLKSTYAEGLANYIEPDGRIRSSFHQTITATGRISSTEPNLQNIPIRMELGRLIRKVFIPQNGCVLIDADYSQIELRVLAHMSGDEYLINAYREAQDIHRMTASQVFHVPFEEVTDLQRRNAKAVNFGIVYGISSFGLSQDLSISTKEAAAYIQSYFETYPGVKQFLDQQVKQAKEQGYVTTMFGRKRPVPELSSGNFTQRSFGERVAMNSPIQGTAADIIKIAMIRVSQSLKEQNLRSKLILQVHDELLVETWEDEIEQVKDILKRDMESAAQLSVKLEIDMKQGKDWYEAH